MIRNFTLLTFLFFILGANIANAQWNQDTSVRNLICTGNYNGQSTVWSDGHDGYIITWLQSTGFSPLTFNMHHLDSAGYKLLAPPNGVNILPGAALNYPSPVQVAVSAGDSSDGYIVWAKHISGNDEMWVQRFDENGNIFLGANGKHLHYTNANDLYTDVKAIQDDSGGVILACLFKPYSTNDKIEIQRIDQQGNFHYSNYRYVGTNSSVSHIYEMVADNDGGAFYFYRVQYDSYVGHFNRDGFDTWSSPVNFAYQVSTDTASAYINDYGTTGCYFTFLDSSDHLYLQHIDSSGTRRWSNAGLVVSDVNDWIWHPTIASDYNGGVFVGYSIRSSSNADTMVYVVKHYDSNGVLTNNTQDTLATTIPRYFYFFKMFPDKTGGAFVTWEVTVNSKPYIYSQHYDINGNKLWRESGYPVVTANNQIPSNCQSSCTFMEEDGISSGDGTFVMAWSDNRASITYTAIYAAKVTGSFTSGINENELSSESILLLPNPAHNELEVFLPGNIQGSEISISIINMLGERIKCAASYFGTQLIFDVSSLPAGVYLLEVKNRTQRIAKKFVRM